MTSEPRQTGEPPRRKFDDIASLFGPIVPGTGAASQFPPHRPAFIPMPPTYTAPIKRPDPVPPQENVEGDLTESVAPNIHITTVPPASQLEPVALPRPQPAPHLLPGSPALARKDPPPVARARPTEIPWPDAFEPRPNYRKREGRNWSWLLLIPAGLVAAAAITMVDARAIRAWIDTTILHRTPIAGTLDSPLLPPAFRTARPSTAGTAPLAEEPIPYPAIPTSPPPNTQSAAPDAATPTPDPAETATPAVTPIRIAVQFRRNIPGADGEARRIAALLQSYGGSVELHPNATTVRVATITYYNAADKDAAAALANSLSNEAPSWLVRLGTTKNPPGTLDVWLP